MDKSREDFETAIKNEFGDSIDYRVCENGEGEYLAWDMQVAWWAWQASRKALVVEMPTQESYDDPLSSYQTIADCAGRIRAAGITVKGEGDEQTNVLSPE